MEAGGGAGGGGEAGLGAGGGLGEEGPGEGCLGRPREGQGTCTCKIRELLVPFGYGEEAWRVGGRVGWGWVRVGRRRVLAHGHWVQGLGKRASR